ncbi:M23 family metallopeptidase [Porticoccaceae bacterium]|nr:M23 family metallopeptidase [Porticoccaceae bacterium]MDA9569798.1 M23 family metallopeptidase [Porticoccaceae bacterium]
MKLILISKRSDKVRTFSLNSWVRILLSAAVLGIPVAAGVLLGLKLADGRWQLLFEDHIADMQNEMTISRQELFEDRQRVNQTLSLMTAKLAQMRASVVRLDALGEQLTELSDMDAGEFDFSAAPGLGGPEIQSQQGYRSNTDMQIDLNSLMQSIGQTLSKREVQLKLLRSTLADKKLIDDRRLAGRPIAHGWQSSAYGMRTDPFTGEQRWHGGVDFAGRLGSDVIAVASGVITWSGEKSGYGKMVEVNHSDGYVTRYAHNQDNIAKLGTVVNKGDVIATMGTSGRSTGPHVHFEVFKNGRVVDPASYIRRTSR